MSRSAKAIAAALVAAMLGGIALVAGVPLLVVVSMMGSQPAQGAGSCLVSPVSPGGQISAGASVVPAGAPYAVSSRFGPRLHPVLGVVKLHTGLDLALTPADAQVVAMKDGVVDSTPNPDWGGNVVVIDHGGGLVSRYAHLSSRSVRAGEQVQAGQPIGRQGSTGWSTGAHLHWEIEVNGALVDPEMWAAEQKVKLDGTPAAAPNRTEPVSRGDRPDAAGDSGRAVGSWSAEQVRIAAIIVRAGQDLELDPWTISVGVMTGMGESSLTNVDHGDAAGPDSIGVFQQRDNGAWGTLADRTDPYRAATMFFKALTAVPGYRSLAPTIAAHRAQRNADPYHYERFWSEAVEVVAVVTDAPDLLASVGSDGGAAACTTPTTAVDLPAGPDGSCPVTGMAQETGLNPPALLTMRCTLAAFDQITTVHGVGTREGVSDHPSGNAVDFMVDNYRTPEGRQYGWQIAEWTKAHADELGVTYIIYDMKIWSVARDSEGWRPYARYGDTPDDTLAHKDHVHVSLEPAFR